MNSTTRDAPSSSTLWDQVSLRRFPYPFRAGLAICSDIDSTRTLERLLAIQEFLNSRYDTGMGPGLGLEIGNSFFPYTPDDSLAFFSSRAQDRDAITALIHAGYVDCIHSYGDGAHTREHAIRAIDALEQAGCKLDVWVDHSHAPSNFGKDVTPGQGDVPGAPVYHADLTLAYGIQFIWKGRTSSILGHGVPFTTGSLTRIFDHRYPQHTLKNIARETAKTALACLSNRRFAIHCGNRLVRADRLRDGHPIQEFKRCNNHWLGLSYGHDAAGLAYVLRPKALEGLIRSQGNAIIYTHLGVGPDHPPFLPAETQAALRHLRIQVEAGALYLTTTSRLLNYHVRHRHLVWTWRADPVGRIAIVVAGIDDPLRGFTHATPDDLQGITFYVPDRHRVDLFCGGSRIDWVERHPADHTGRESVSFPRLPLEYPLPPARMLLGARYAIAREMA